MSDAEVSMILDRGLTAEEKAKLKQVEGRMSASFAAAGYAVRVCEGEGEGEDRMIGFIPGLVGPPLVSLPANQFLALSLDELLRALESRMDSRNAS